MGHICHGNITTARAFVFIMELVIGLTSHLAGIGGWQWRRRRGGGGKEEWEEKRWGGEEG